LLLFLEGRKKEKGLNINKIIFSFFNGKGEMESESQVNIHNKLPSVFTTPLLIL